MVNRGMHDVLDEVYSSQPVCECTGDLSTIVRSAADRHFVVRHQRADTAEHLCVYTTSLLPGHA